ncbi:hypothetical protein BDV25DRAFT_42880 [Aspergillus avenaceus]|uniref:FAD-binding domain-containing protein n=1 Tax=Aspergillus avenaceus TaxID=36643 RepID=A0A5N6TLI8_ASPAV|nr:hypothetical protein BDV25DRAFT_42880 [Aspergillus avenaceus]
MPNLTILISGAGITGNALAFWRNKIGHRVTVVERSPKLRESGLQVDLREPGITVMKRMGLEEAFRAKSVPEQGMEFVDHSGRRKAYFAANRSGLGMQAFVTEYEIMRGDLCRLLYDATDGRGTYMFGAFVQSFTQDQSGVDVLFSTGQRDRFDLLIGADGQGSHTRKMMLGPNVPDPFHPLGVHIGYFTIPQSIRSGEAYNVTIYIAPGRRFLGTRRHSPDDIQAYLACRTDSERLTDVRGDVEEEKAALTEIFRGAGWETERILKGLEASDDFYCERLGVVRLDSWSSGRVVLVGDAAYCPSATTGMGTTSGLAGAYVLAGEISTYCSGEDTMHGGLHLALKGYDDVFRPFMDRVQRGIEKGSTYWDKIPAASWQIAILNFVLGLAAFLRLDVFAQFFLCENVRWKLPDYPRLVQESK